MAKWLIRFKPNIHANSDFAGHDHDDSDFAFRLSCKNGHLEVVKWLISLDPEYELFKNYKY